jgi:large subunit ribosomal protein L29
MKQSEVKELSTKDLAEKITDQKALLTKVKMGHKVSPIENPLKIRESRRTIARLKTELVKRQHEEAKKQ